MLRSRKITVFQRSKRNFVGEWGHVSTMMISNTNSELQLYPELVFSLVDLYYIMLYSVGTLWNTINKSLWKGYLLALILSFGPQIHRYILSVSFQRILSILALETGLFFDYARSSYTNEKPCNHQTSMACFVDCLSLLQG